MANSDTARVPWPRILLEGIVIVASILLAFGIDAWWDGRVGRAETRKHLEAVRYELRENLGLLDEQADFCVEVGAATDGVLVLMGPDPTLVSPDSLLVLLSQALSGSIGNRLGTTALDAMIAEGQFASIESVSLRRALGAWRSSAVDQRVQQRDNARFQLRNTVAYAQTILPYSLLATRDRPRASRFPLDVSRVLSDRDFEGALSQLAGWREGICRFDRLRRTEVLELLAAIDAELAR